jgi:hypothetical protein
MGTIPSLQRVEFFSGELLTADDLTTLSANNQQLRWLHNRTMHNWGIAFGLDVQGARGATSVTVNPGIAVDALGREVILSSPVQQPIPAVPGGPNGTAAAYYLVANFVPDSDEAVVEQRSATACGTGGSVRLSNAPAILWKTNAQLDNGIDIILAGIDPELRIERSRIRRGPAQCGERRRRFDHRRGAERGRRAMVAHEQHRHQFRIYGLD